MRQDTDEEHDVDADSYFADPLQSQSSATLAASDSTSGHPFPANRPPAPRAIVDEHGHIVRRSVLEEGTRPEFIIPVGSASGVWGMMKRVGRYKTEGWFALWKGLYRMNSCLVVELKYLIRTGLLTSCITEILSDTFQPFVNAFLQSLFFPSISPFHHPPILIPFTSHLLTGFILSPLDLIRTRLIVQSSNPKHRTYSGPIDAFQQILRDEGGLRGMYLHPHLLIPTILDNALRPIVALALPGMLTSYFGWGHITEDTHPIGWGVAELAGSCLGLLVTLPIETIRRRLQAQVRGNAMPLKTCVEMRPKPYNGIVDAFWHILTEERSDLPIVRRRKRRNNGKGKEKEGASDEEEEEYESWWKHTGLGQLYRGLGMRLGASAVVFVLALFGGGGDFGSSDGGWAEI
jgi:fusion and transport protein UGO1